MSSVSRAVGEFVLHSTTVGLILAGVVLALLLVSELLVPGKRPALRRVVRVLDIATLPAFVAIVALIGLRFGLIR
jgi:hypothetical protein